MKRIVCLVVMGLLVFGAFAVILTDNSKDKSTTPTDDMTQEKTTPQDTTPSPSERTSKLPSKLVNIPAHSNLNSYVFHAPIEINGNIQFSPNGTNGVVLGNGTKTNPYIILDWELNVTTIGGNGIKIKDTSVYFIIKNCFIHSTNGCVGIYLINVTNAKIENNTLTTKGCGIWLLESISNVIINNFLTKNSYAITVTRSNYSIISNNTITNSTLDGIDLNASNNCSVIYNRLSLIPNHNMEIWGSRDNKILFNTFDNGFFGIYFQTYLQIVWKYATNNTVTHNRFSVMNYSIEMQSASSNIITFNDILKSPREGMSMVNSSNNVISNNNISQNKHGIFIQSACRYNIISYNNITNNTGYGLFSYWNTNKYNYIHHNNFIKNNGAGSIFSAAHIQANDIGLNFWNTSTEGNYWSDWTSPDANNDGIVDNSYVIGGGSGDKDYHPIADWSKIPETPSILPLIICSVLILTAIIVRLRKSNYKSPFTPSLTSSTFSPP